MIWQLPHAILWSQARGLVPRLPESAVVGGAPGHTTAQGGSCVGKRQVSSLSTSLPTCRKAHMGVPYGFNTAALANIRRVFRELQL